VQSLSQNPIICDKREDVTIILKKQAEIISPRKISPKKSKNGGEKISRYIHSEKNRRKTSKTTGRNTFTLQVGKNSRKKYPTV
jgi:hypothetical protein